MYCRRERFETVRRSWRGKWCHCVLHPVSQTITVLLPWRPSTAGWAQARSTGFRDPCSSHCHSWLRKWCSNDSTFTTDNSNYIKAFAHIKIARIAYSSTNKTKIIWIERELISFYPKRTRLMFSCVCRRDVASTIFLVLKPFWGCWLRWTDELRSPKEYHGVE